MARKQAFHQDFPVVEFVPGTSIYTSRQGDLCLTVKAAGVEPGCHTVEDLEAIQDEFRSAMAVFDPAYRVHFTLFNTRLTEFDWVTSHPDSVMAEAIDRRIDAVSSRALFRKELFFTFILTSSVAHELALVYGLGRLMKGAFERAEALLQRVRHFQNRRENAKDPIQLLDREETKRFLHRFVAFRPHNLSRALPHDSSMDYWIPNATPTLHPSFVWHDGEYIKAAVVRELPQIPDMDSDPDPRKQIVGSYAGIWNKTLDLNCAYILTVEWHQVADNPMRGRLKTLHKSYDNQITSLTARMTAGPNDTRSDLRQDTEATYKRDQIGRAKLSLSEEPWGEYYCSVVLHAPELRQVEDAMPHVFHALKGATVLQEDQAIYDAWTNAIPGNFRRNVRSLYAPIRAAVDTFPLWNDYEGSPENDFFPDGKAFAIVETEHNGLHYLAPNEGPVFGNLLFGEQGGGKTTFANHLLENTARQWVYHRSVWVRPKILVLDMKDSYRENTLRFGGTYLKLSMDQPGLKVNPWSLPYSKNSVETIKRLIKVMLRGDDGFVTSPEQDSIITQQVEANYHQKRHSGLAFARLRKVNLGATMQPRLAPWINDGQYAKFFDNDCDDLETAGTDWLTIQFTGFAKHSHVLQPILYWHWERFMGMVQNESLTAVPKLALLDEAHEQMMMSPEIGQRMLDGINTGRSYNFWNIFVMQWAHLLASHPLGPAIIAACPVKWFCSSRNIDSKTYADIFEMSLKTAQTIKTLVPRREVLRYSAAGAQKLSLVLDPITLGIYANDVKSNAARYERQAAATA